MRDVMQNPAAADDLNNEAARLTDVQNGDVARISSNVVRRQLMSLLLLLSLCLTVRIANYSIALPLSHSRIFISANAADDD